MTAREVAIDLIRFYVLRGDTLESLKAGQQGAYSDDYHASISGYSEPGNPKTKVDSNHILVTQVEGKEVVEIFSLKELYDEIASGKIQQQLF